MSVGAHASGHPGEGSRRRTPTTVTARIVDDAGDVVAERTLSDRSGRACLPLAHAVGAWASLVLDAEMNRVKEEDDQDAATASPPVTNSVVRIAVGFAGASPGRGADAAADEAVESEPGMTGNEPRRSVEVGSMAYLRNGMTTDGGVAGLAPFVTVEVTPGWVLRPGLFFGRSTAAQASDLISHLGTRVDFCRRVPGNYIARRGLELDVCAGTEAGVVTAGGQGADERTIGRLGLGPSANLRGELGAGIALEVRGVLGVNMIQYASLSPLVFSSGELGVSVRLP